MKSIKRDLILLTAAVAMIAMIAGCSFPGRGIGGSGKSEKKEDLLRSFQVIKYSAPGTLVLKSGSKRSLVIEGDDNIVPLCSTIIDHGTLVISIKDEKTVRPNRPLVFTVTAPNLSRMSLKGDGDVKIEGFATSKLDLENDGTGDYKINGLKVNELTLLTYEEGAFTIDNMDVGLLEVEANGTSDIVISGGTVIRQVVNINGDGDYMAKGLKSDEAAIGHDGTGFVTIRVKDTLDVNLSGTGDVRYIGNPEVEEVSQGMGQLKKIED